MRGKLTDPFWWYEIFTEILAIASTGYVAGYLGYIIGLVLTPNSLGQFFGMTVSGGIAISLLFGVWRGFMTAAAVGVLVFAVIVLGGDFNPEWEYPPAIITSAYFALSSTIGVGVALPFIGLIRLVRRRVRPAFRPSAVSE